MGCLDLVMQIRKHVDTHIPRYPRMNNGKSLDGGDLLFAEHKWREMARE